MAGPAATKPCVVYAQLLKTLCLDCVSMQPLDRHCQLNGGGDNLLMESLYRRHHFPPEIISHAVWRYHRFTLSFRDVEESVFALLNRRLVSVNQRAQI